MSAVDAAKREVQNIFDCYAGLIARQRGYLQVCANRISFIPGVTYSEVEGDVVVVRFVDGSRLTSAHA